jgi:hypothetical protein
MTMRLLHMFHTYRSYFSESLVRWSQVSYIITLEVSLRPCLGISGMKRNEVYWGGGISIITQNFPKSPSILFHPLQSSVSQTSP